MAMSNKLPQQWQDGFLFWSEPRALPPALYQYLLPPKTQSCSLQGGEKFSLFHCFEHIGNMDVTLVIDVVRIIFLLAFLVFLKSSSSSNRSCRQETTEHQSNLDAPWSSISWNLPAPHLPPNLKSFGPLCSQSLASHFSCPSPHILFLPL